MEFEKFSITSNGNPIPIEQSLLISCQTSLVGQGLEGEREAFLIVQVRDIGHLDYNGGRKT